MPMANLETSMSMIYTLYLIHLYLIYLHIEIDNTTPYASE